MGIISSLKSTSISTLAVKAAGLAGIGAIAWDAHSHAKAKGAMTERNEKTDSLTKSYMGQFKSDSASFVKDSVKKRLFAFEADENVSGFFTNLKGYVGGFASMLIDDVVPLGLSLGALVAPKGLISKGFGLGLIAYGGVFLAQEFFGIGKAR